MLLTSLGIYQARDTIKACIAVGTRVVWWMWGGTLVGVPCGVISPCALSLME